MRLGNLGGRGVVLVGDHAVDVAEASGGELSSDPMTLVDLRNHARLRRLAEDPSAVQRAAPYDRADLGPPVPRPGKIIGVGLNYRSHAAEGGMEIPDQPALFAKFLNCLVGPTADILLPTGRTKVDYEAEVVVVIGAAMKAIDPADVWAGIAGITAGQDISDRLEQLRPPLKQFTLGKSYDTFGPIGPSLATIDELADPDDIDLRCSIDGDEVQRASTSDLIFSVPDLVGWTSRYVTLEPGDLIFTGTPAGVGMSRSPRRYLKDGNVIETVVTAAGTMRNQVVEVEGP